MYINPKVLAVAMMTQSKTVAQFLVLEIIRSKDSLFEESPYFFWVE